MRIQGSSATAAAAASLPARRSAGGEFVVADGAAARATGGPATLRNVAGIDALLALQGVEEPAERRRHAVKRGRLALDALDELKIGLLGGDLTPGTLQKLKAIAAHLQDGSGDSGLDSVLSEIGLRVEVEIAKLSAP